MEINNMGIPWTVNDISFLKNNFGKIPIDKMAVELNRSGVSIDHKLSILRAAGEISGATLRPNGFSKEEIEILKEKYPNGGTREVQKYINRDKESIMTKAKRLGLKREAGFRRNKLNLDYLINPNTPQAAYILGLLWADGCIYVEGFMRRVVLTLVDNDFSEIAHLFNEWHFNVIDHPKHKTWQVCYMARLYHREFGDFLINHGYYLKSQCSPTKILNKIPEPIRHYFYRGWFDGDGNNTVLVNRHVICIAGGYDQDWSDVINLCTKMNLNHRITKIINKNTDNKGSVINISNIDSCYRFLKYIYSGEAFGLSRKYNNYVEFCKKYNLEK